MMATSITRLGPYELLKNIGRGGMAEVFLARDTRTGRQVALKQVAEGTDADTREILDAEQRGARLQEEFGKVNTHVPAVYDYGVDAGFFYVAMEYIDGENLSELIFRGPLAIDRAVAIAADLCRFIEQAHAFEPTGGDQPRRRSLIHGDLTASNVRITPASQVKVLDFGIAKTLSLTRKVTRNDYGSLAYLSPERLDSTEVDRYSDFWSIGVLLYEMVRGEKPFKAPDPRRLEQLILSRRPPSPLDGRCPLALQAIIAKLLAPDATHRYDSARAIGDDLERFTSGQPTHAEQEGWPARSDLEPVTRRTRPPSTVDEEPTRRTRKPAGDSQHVESRRAAPARTGRKRRLSALVLLIVIMGIGFNELLVSAAARRVARVVPTRELDGLTDAWSQYDALSRRSYLRFATEPLLRSLTQQTSKLADRVIENYRTPTPTVRETQWKMAREALARAVAANPDSRVQAALRYCEGHLHRINGEARLARKQVTAAQHEFTEAVTAFREAARLHPSWPDPFLGLARTFIYGLEDVDRGADALNQAERLGYPPGDRETVQLADGYRARAETLARSARRLKGMSQERDYLTRAMEAYQQAITLYGKVVGFGDVPRSLSRSQRDLEQIERRLAELSQTGRFDLERLSIGRLSPPPPSLTSSVWFRRRGQASSDILRTSLSARSPLNSLCVRCDEQLKTAVANGTPPWA